MPAAPLYPAVVQCARGLFLHTLFWLTALRGPSESYRDVSLRLVKAG